MDDCKKTINVSYPNEEPCEQTSAYCVITEEAISYLGIEQGENIDLVFKKLVQSLIEARTRLKTAENNITSSTFGFVTPGTITLSGSSEQTLIDTIVGSKTFSSGLRKEDKVYELEVEGKVTNSSTANSNVFKIKVGATDLLTFSTEAGAAYTDTYFKIKTTIIFEADGVFAYGFMRVGSNYYSSQNTIVVDNTVSEDLDVTFSGIDATDSTTSSVRLKSIIN